MLGKKWLGIHRAISIELAFAAVVGFGVGGVQAGQGVPPTVAVRDNPTQGRILTDADGWTLYTWEGDEPGVSYCDSQCAAVWPPLLVDGDPVAFVDLPGTLDVAERDEDGTWQVTYDGWPLYYFNRDAQPGNTNGQGVVGFGARWSVIVVGGPPVAQPPAPPVIQPTRIPSAPTQAPPPPPTQAPRATATPQAMPAAVTIADFEFRPGTLSVPVGAPVTWTNNGPSSHTATSDTGAFDTGSLSRGQSGSFTFTAAGTFAYHCAIHPSMHGTIVVGTRASATQAQASQSYSSSSSPGYGNYASNYPYMPNNGFMGYDGYMGAYGGYRYPGMGYPGLLSGSGYQNPYYPNPYAFRYPVPGLPITGQPALPGPTGLMVVATTSTTVTLVWTASPGAVSYQVQQAFSPTVQASRSTVMALAGTSATVTGLIPNMTYFFHVHAVDAYGTLSQPSNIVEVRTSP